MKLLLVEDDLRVAELVERGLRQLGFQVDVATDGRAGLARALNGAPELVVLDLLLPVLDGHGVLAGLRAAGRRMPVLVLSACEGVGERVRVLDRGADDYLVKPFSFDELVARVRALLRRQAPAPDDVLAVADLRLDTRTRCVERGGVLVTLTAKEFALLEYLMRNRGAVVTRAMIAEQVWGQHFGSFSNVIDVYIRYLRSKIDADRAAKLIHTVRGVGYVLSETLR